MRQLSQDAGYSRILSLLPTGRAWPWLMLAAGLVATFFAQQSALNDARRIQQDGFDFQASQIRLQIEQRLKIYEQVLQGARGLFIASRQVGRNEFRDYVESLQLQENYPGIQGVGYARVIPPDGLGRHIADVRREGFSRYMPYPREGRDPESAIVYLEPFSGRNLRAFGYDMYSEPVRREAMERARDNASAAMSGKVRLVQETGPKGQPGFLIYLPVYRNDRAHETLEDRRSNLVGWVYAPFRMDDLMQGVLGVMADKFDLHIDDGKVVTAESLMYDNDRHLGMPGGVQGASLYQSRQSIEFAGHRWTIGVRSLPAFEAALDTSSVVTIRMAGISLSVMVALAMWLLIRARARALRQARELGIAATVFESRDGMFVTDEHGTILRANSAAAAITGYSAEECMGKNPRLFKSGRQDEAFYADMWRRIHADGGWSGEIWNRRKDGEVYPEQLTITAVKDASGAITNFIATFSDITERKLMEQVLLDTMHQLEEKELAKTRFLAAAGHDLRQPVAAASLFIDALKFTPLDERQTELVGHLGQSMTIFADMLDRLLNISRFDAGLVKAEPVSFDLGSFLSEFEQGYAQQALDKGLRLKSFVSARALPVFTDKALLRNLLMNLTTNALKYTAHGGVLIAARRRGDRVLLQVWDTGIGIAPQDVERVFDEFYQVDNPGRNREGGLGLGLSICKRIAAVLGTQIVCRSHPGRGSVFELTLPVERRRERRSAGWADVSPATMERDVLAGKRIVIVEDDEYVGKAIEQMMLAQGATVQRFDKGEAVLRNPRAVAADRFVVDYSLGQGLNGYQLLETLEMERASSVHAVILTGETSSEFLGGIANGPWPVLHKPVSGPVLVAHLA